MTWNLLLARSLWLLPRAGRLSFFVEPLTWFRSCTFAECIRHRSKLIHLLCVNSTWFAVVCPRVWDHFICGFAGSYEKRIDGWLSCLESSKRRFFYASSIRSIELLGCLLSGNGDIVDLDPAVLKNFVDRLRYQISDMSNLAHLCLFPCHETVFTGASDSLRKLLEAARGLPLRSLSLGHAPTGADSFGQCLGSWTKLEKVFLFDLSSSPYPELGFAKSLATNIPTRLTSLKFDFRIGSKESVQLLEKMERLENLDLLGVPNNWPVSLGEVIIKKANKSLYFVFEKPTRFDTSMMAILQRCTSLQFLTIRGLLLDGESKQLLDTALDSLAISFSLKRVCITGTAPHQFEFIFVRSFSVVSGYWSEEGRFGISAARP